MAWRAASTARFSPDARPMPMRADPASRMIARTSAKSRLMRPGTVMMSEMPCTPWRRTSSTTRNASRMRVFFWTTSRRRSFGIVMSVSTLDFSSSAAFSADELALGALERERLGDHADGQRALLLRDLRDDRRPAGARPAAEAAVMNTMSEPSRASAILSRSSSAARSPMLGRRRRRGPG